MADFREDLSVKGGKPFKIDLDAGGAKQIKLTLPRTHMEVENP